MIPDSFIQTLLERVDVVDVVGRYVQLRKGGVNLVGLCPFHNEKTPSFTVSPSKQFYYCFGCGEHGNAIQFLIKHTATSFPDAVRTLASTAGLTVPEEKVHPKQAAQKAQLNDAHARHTKILEAAQAHYVRLLSASQPAKAYLKGRGIDQQTATSFGLGWSGTSRYGLSQIFSDDDDQSLIESGLVIVAEDARRYDRFRERVMFPIRNVRGKLIGFGARTISNGTPKYLNSPETSFFSKGSELYGLWESRKAIHQAGQVLVVEGYMDVIGLAQQGIHYAVATLGTATTAEHLKKLLRVSDKIIFSFDGDAAGRHAAWRALQVCLPILRDDINIRFLFLPPEHDPDSYVQALGAEGFKAEVGQATALSRFLLNELASRHALTEAEGRASCLSEASRLLKPVPKINLRLQIEHELARLVQLTVQEVEQILQQNSSQVESKSQPFEIPASNHLVRKSRKNKWTGRSTALTDPLNLPTHCVPVLAQRLICLLLSHIELIDNMGDQQLEIIDHAPHLRMVKALIVLVQSSGARHMGALLQVLEPDSELAILLNTLSGKVLAQADLPDPQAEWNGALNLLEFKAVSAEIDDLIATGLTQEADRKRYNELRKHFEQLKNARMEQIR